MDGGSVERWEDEDYRDVYKRILKGDWEGFDAWDIGEPLSIICMPHAFPLIWKRRGQRRIRRSTRERGLAPAFERCKDGLRSPIPVLQRVPSASILS
jgi:hypothetical protein